MMKNVIHLLTGCCCCLLLCGQTTRTVEVADSLCGQAGNLMSEGRLGEAVEALLEADAIYSDLSLQAERLERLTAAGKRLAQRHGDWRSAQRVLEPALEAAIALGDSAALSYLEMVLGIVHFRQGDHAVAIELMEGALTYFESVGDSLNQQKTLINLGNSHLFMADYYNAEQRFVRAANLAAARGDSLILARVAQNSGLLHFQQGRYGEAYNDYILALEIGGDRLYPLDRGEIDNNLGIVHKAYGDSARAAARLGAALATAESLDHRDLKARVLNNLGRLAWAHGEHTLAADYFERSLALKREINNRLGVFNTLFNLGSFYQTRGDTARAWEYFRQAEELNQTLGYFLGEARLHYAYGKLQRDAGFPEPALDHLRQGSKLAQRLAADDVLYAFYDTEASCHLLRGDTLAAIRALENSLELIENIRSGIDIEADRELFLTKMLPVYRELLQLQLAGGDRQGAYETFERMKVRNLLDMLDGAFLVFETEMTKAELARKAELESNLRLVKQEVRQLHSDGTRGAAPVIDSLVLRQQRVRGELLAFEDELFLRHPELQLQMGKGEPIGFRDAAKLLNQNEAALCYLVEEETTTCLVLRNQGRRQYSLTPYRLQVGREQLRASAATIHTDTDFFEMSRLYTQLIDPVTISLEGVERLCIIPDAYLHALPFQAFLNPATERFLIEDYAVYYVYSLSTLAELRATGTAGRETVLALGNPDLGEQGMVTLSGVFQALPASEQEVQAVGSIYGDRAQLFLHNQASESVFKQYAAAHGLLHLATHGLLDEVNPLFSALLLSSDKAEDGLLTAREIITLELNADLVVLSACATARGVLSEGEGMLGLSRAFFGAQVPTIIASLWQVEDESTRILMEQFFRNIKNDLRPAKALQAAQLYLLNQTEYSYPFFWAPFQVFGDCE